MLFFVSYLKFPCSRHLILFIIGVDEADADTGDIDDILDVEVIGESSDQRSGLHGADDIDHVTDITEALDSVDEDSRTNVALNNTTSFSSLLNQPPQKDISLLHPLLQVHVNNSLVCIPLNRMLG